jgi:hypothetical protein
MWVSRKVWTLLIAEMDSKERHLRKAYERIDRLTEALSQRNHIPLIMPQAELPKFEAVKELEKIPGWFDNKPRPVNPPVGEKQ